MLVLTEFVHNIWYEWGRVNDEFDNILISKLS